MNKKTKFNARIIRIGASKGITIPKPELKKLGADLNDIVIATIERKKETK